MELTRAEKVAGRHFRDFMQYSLDEINADRPAKAKCSRSSPPFFRHYCTRGTGGTVALRLTERPSLSPEVVVHRDGDGKLRAVYSWLYTEDLGPQVAVIAAGLFAFTYLEGTCHAAGCGFSVRSGTGSFRVVEAADNGG